MLTCITGTHQQAAGSNHCPHTPLGPLQAPPAGGAGLTASRASKLTYLSALQCYLHSSKHALQVHTSRQLAATIVHTHPWVPCKHLLLEELASQRAEPADHELLNTAETDLVDYAVQWQEVVRYLQQISPANLHKHVPLRQQEEQLSKIHQLDDLTLAQEVLDALL